MIKDEKGRFPSREANVDEKEEDFGYYSKILQKPFNSIDELKKAEKVYREEQNEKLAKISEKKTLAKNIEDAYANYISILEDGNKQISEFIAKTKQKQQDAYNKYIDERNKFIQAYGSFHMTFVDKKPHVDTQTNAVDMKKAYEDTLNNLFDAFKSFPFNFY